MISASPCTKMGSVTGMIVPGATSARAATGSTPSQRVQARPAGVGGSQVERSSPAGRARTHTARQGSDYFHLLPQKLVRASLPTPVCFPKLKPYLVRYSQPEVQYLEAGFTHGFRLGALGTDPLSSQSVCKPCMEASLHLVMSDKIQKEIVQGRVAGPFVTLPFTNFHCSPVRPEPKKVKGEYRLIHNLSHPFQSPESVNSNIPHGFKSVNYATLDDAVKVIKELGTGAFLAKTDIDSVFKIIPMHPDDYHLLGFQWQGQYAKTLPMGAGSSWAIFEYFSTGLQYVAEKRLGIKHCIHILDRIGRRLLLWSPAKIHLLQQICWDSHSFA